MSRFRVEHPALTKDDVIEFDDPSEDDEIDRKLFGTKVHARRPEGLLPSAMLPHVGAARVPLGVTLWCMVALLLAALALLYFFGRSEIPHIDAAPVDPAAQAMRCRASGGTWEPLRSLPGMGTCVESH